MPQSQAASDLAKALGAAKSAAEANDVAALQATLKIFENPNSQPSDLMVAMATLESGLVSQTRLAKVQAMEDQILTQLKQIVSNIAAELSTLTAPGS